MDQCAVCASAAAQVSCDGCGKALCFNCFKFVSGKRLCPACQPSNPAPAEVSKTGATLKGLGCLALAILLGVLFFAAVCESPKSPGGSDTSSTSTTDLKASVRFTGTQFVITNRDTFPWTDVELDVNGGTFSSGYTLSVKRMEAGQVYTVGAMQFANSDGVRFNPFQMKPKKFTIKATANGNLAFYFGGWE